jgi:hypothetical protein
MLRLGGEELAHQRGVFFTALSDRRILRFINRLRHLILLFSASAQGRVEASSSEIFSTTEG